jgi:hypothetical protein
MKYQVYKIHIFDAKSNGYSVGIREESWISKFDSEFDNLSEVKKYVIQKNIQVSDLPLFLIGLSQSAKEKFIEEFCFSENPKWVCKRRYFIGKPNKDLIRQGLEMDNVRFIE